MKYELQQTIAPGDQMWVNLAQLVRNGVGDRNGNYLPTDVTAVTYDLQDLTPGGHSLMANDLAVNTALGQAVPACPWCCGYLESSVIFNPYPADVIIDGFQDLGIDGTNSCTGVINNIYVDFTIWSSSNTSIANVTKGQVQGLAVGNVTGSAQGTVQGPGECACSPYPAEPVVPITVAKAIPTKFTSSPGTPINPPGSLFFTYSWSSSSGNMSDLSSCKAGETVFYPNYPSTPYTWPLPMVATTINPGVVSGSASSGGFEDTNYPPDSYQQPYSAASFQATQRLWWSCPDWNNGNQNEFVPDITITRKVFKDTDGFWKYQITKSGYTNTIKLPNQ
jgi:hypothetical protein